MTIYDDKSRDWPFPVRRLEKKLLPIEMFEFDRPLPGYKDPRTMSDEELRRDWDNNVKATAEDPGCPVCGGSHDLASVEARAAALHSLIDSPTHGTPTGRLSGASGGPKDSLAGHGPFPRAKDVAAQADTASRGLERTVPPHRPGYIVYDFLGVRLLLTDFEFEAAEPPYAAKISYSHIYVMRDMESFPIDIEVLLGEKEHDLLIEQVINEIESGK